jgi:hypothetical protein
VRVLDVVFETAEVPVSLVAAFDSATVRSNHDAVEFRIPRVHKVSVL